jgi:hypothetical protein
LVARRTAKDTARLIEEVARGERLLEEIHDPRLRETVRLALRLHKDPFAAPDARTRARIRSRVLERLRPRGASIADRITLAFEVLAKPTPYAMRTLALAVAVACVAVSTTVISAGAVPEDPLYTVKRASEQARLALTTTPEDRAVAELSIAEHRLTEATMLAANGSEDDAIAATSEYGQHLANAAAELAQVETFDPSSAALVAQLQEKIEEHRAVVIAALARLSEQRTRPTSIEVLAVLAKPAEVESDLTPAAAIAERAASATDLIAALAERNVATRATEGDDEDGDDARALQRDDPQRAMPGSRRDSRATASATSRAERAAEVARKAAAEAKSAAKKAKQGSRRAASPAQTLRRP